VENLWVTKGAKDVLQLVHNTFRVLARQCTKVYKTSAVVLDHQHPAYQNTKRITLSELAKINEMKLKSIAKFFGQDGFPTSPCRFGDKILPHAYEACCTISPNKTLSAVKVLFLAVSRRPFHAYMAITTVLFINGTEDLIP
jgi:hypothetical protein